MKAAILNEDGSIRYGDWPDPELKEGEALVRVRAAGICGSDIPRVLRGKAHHYPIVLGHEFSGEVLRVRGESGRIQPGMRVSVAPLLPCMVCLDCLKGDYALCHHYSFIGSRVQGGFAEYVAVPASNLIPFEPSVSWVEGALFEPSTVALHGLYLNGFSPAEHTAVLGFGTIGQFTAQWARIKGAGSLTVLDVEEERLEMANRLGISNALDSAKEGFMDRALSLTGDRGFGFVFETAGATQTMRQALRLAANKARICFIGTPQRELCFTPQEWENLNRKELSLTGSWMSYSAPFPGKEWEETARAFSGGELRIDPRLIFRSFPLSEAQQAFDLFRVPGQVRGKVMLLPDG